MAKIIISDLHSLDEKTFLNDLNSVDTNAVLGGDIESFFDKYSTTLLTAFQEGLNTLAGAYPVINVNNNKFLTIDLSGLTINLVRLI
jgi:hypothetical protein